MSDRKLDAARKDIDAMTQPLRTWVASRGYSVRREQAAIAALDDFADVLTLPGEAATSPTGREHEPDVRGMAEVIRLNCKDLDTATEVLRTYLLNARGDAIQTYLRESLPHVLEGAREQAYDKGREDHQAHDCCQRMRERVENLCSRWPVCTGSVGE